MDRVTLIAGQTLPGDRVWAIAHDLSDAPDDMWSRCGGFLRAASSPRLMAVEARRDGGTLVLTHPDRPELAIDPDADSARLLEWLAPLVAEGRPAPARVVRAPAGHGMTDTSAPSITLGNLTSHRIVAERLGRDLSIHRWRCNLWMSGLAPWEEFDLVGRHVRLGDTVLEVYKRIDRCRATEANPQTGRRDADTLSVLDEFGHRDFTVGLRVVEGGELAIGDVLCL